MSDSLVYNIPAWSKDIDLFASPLPDLYAARRMSDDALSAATTTDPDSPATEPDIVPSTLHDSLTALHDPLAPTHDHLHDPHPRKPSLPGIGALTPLLDPTDSIHRRASLPTLASDLAIARSPAPRVLPFRSPPAIPRPYDPALATYAFPGSSSPDTYSTLPTPGSASSAFPSPFASPLSPAPFPQYTPQWSPTDPPTTAAAAAAAAAAVAASSSPDSPRSKRRPSPSTAVSQSADVVAQPQQQQQQQRRRGKLPKHTTDLLKEWLHAHSDHPYPSEDEKRDLCARTKLSMSQVSNWMINARRRILAPAKHPAQAATTTEPYRPLGARPIGALYPPHHPYPRYPAPRDDALRLYDPTGFAPPPTFPPFQPSPGFPDRRLAYPASTLAPSPDSFYGPNSGVFGLPPQHQRDAAAAAAAAAAAPRYFAAAPDL